MKAAILGTCALVLAAGAAYGQTEPPATPPPEPQQQPAPPPPPQQQQQQEQTPMAPPAGARTEVSDDDLQKFAEIYVEVEKARNDLTLEMNEATSQEEAQDIQARMQEQIVAAISEHGWSVEKYNEVATAITNDPELRSEAVELINELSSS